MATRAGAPVALILAAGRGERLGSAKLLENLDGQAVVERTIQAFLKAERTQDIVLVVAAGERERYDWLKSLRVHLVENPAPERGMITSIRAGLQSSWSLEKDFFVHPADVCFVKSEWIDRIAREFRTRGCRILIPTYQGLGGHPGLYASSLRDEFFLHGDQSGAREVLLRHRDATARVNIPDPDICFDIDTPEDLRAALDPGARWARVERQLEEKRAGRSR
jgi:molybdenum cofactor cytidylyltransferase